MAAVFGVFVLLVLPLFAWAADNVVTRTTIDLSPVLNAAIEMAAAILRMITIPMF